MPGVTVPEFDSLAQGLGYAHVPSPTDDACEIPGPPLKVDGVNVLPAPVDQMSIATTSMNAPENVHNEWTAGTYKPFHMDGPVDWSGKP